MALTKTFKRLKVVRDAVTASEASAGKKNILIVNTAPSGTALSGSGLAHTDDFIYNINITRSGADFTSKAKHAYSIYSGTVVVETNSSNYVLTTADVITISGTYL